MLPFFRFNVFFADSLRRLFIPDVQTPDTKPKIVGWTKKLLSEAIKADINHDGSFGKLKRYAKKRYMESRSLFSFIQRVFVTENMDHAALS